jgi:hypothetical protein
MDTWLRKQTISIFDLFTVNPTSADENFYGLEEQLAIELASRTPEDLPPAPLPEIEPGEFEQLYGWFLA